MCIFRPGQATTWNKNICSRCSSLGYLKHLCFKLKMPHSEFEKGILNPKQADLTIPAAFQAQNRKLDPPPHYFLFLTSVLACWTSTTSAFRNCTINVPKDIIEHRKESKPALKNVPLVFLEKWKCSFHFIFVGHTTKFSGAFNVSCAVVTLKEINLEILIKEGGAFECQLKCCCCC